MEFEGFCGYPLCGYIAIICASATNNVLIMSMLVCTVMLVVSTIVGLTVSQDCPDFGLPFNPFVPGQNG